MTRGTPSIRISREDADWLADAMPPVFWLAGANGKICYLSEAFSVMTGLDATDVIAADRWKDVVHPEDLPSLSALWRSARASAGESRSFFRMRFHGGGYHWMHSFGRPVMSPETGAVTHWIGGLVDVDAALAAKDAVGDGTTTARYKADVENSLSAPLRWRFRALFHDRNIGVIEIDLGGAKARFDEVLGKSSASLSAPLEKIPNLLEDLLANAQVTGTNRTLALMLGFADSEAGAFESGGVRSEPGLVEVLRLAVRSVFGTNCNRDGVVELAKVGGGHLSAAYSINVADDFSCYATLVDITEQRTAAMLQLSVQAELAKANRAATVGALSLSIAHELNQPITSMRIEMLSLERSIAALNLPTGTIQAGLNRITRQCERLAEVIQTTRGRMLDHGAKVDIVDVAHLAAQIPTLLRREIEEDSIVMNVDIPEAPCLLRADASELQQVLVNLVLNAIEAMRGRPTGPRVVHLRIGHVDKFVRVRVEDTGNGIAEADLRRIFEPFFTTKPGGVGMGLQICRTLIEAIGGDLQARNTDGGGAVFEFRVPYSGHKRA